jgi:adenylate cyclase
MLRLTLFGRFSAAGADGAEISLKSQKAQALLAYLALPPGKPRSREEIMALLWSDRGEAQARASLRQVLTGLRKDLGEQAMKALNITDDAVSLDPDRVTVAVAGAGEELLAGFHLHDPAFEEWLRDERLRFEDTAAPGYQPAGLSPSDKPSIAVLPFTNMSGDPEQEYFSDGITEDIITGLSRFSSLSVVARTSTFVYRDSAVNVTEAGKALGARYLLEGSLRKAGNRVRLTAQLIDVESGKHIWAERYDRVLEDIFAIQDELVHAIVATLVGRLETALTERALHKHPENLAAYDYYLKALQFERRYDAEGIREGRKALEKAVALDPGFAKAHALLANIIFMAAWFEGTEEHVYDDEALAIARRAVELDPNDGDCYAKLAVVHLQRREFDQAQHYLEQALALNPHNSTTWSHYAWYLVSIGKPQQALDRLSEREAVEPFPPNWHWELRGLALYELGRYEEAASTFARMTNLNYWDHGFLCACYGQLGQTNKARAHWEKVLEVVPDATAEFLLEGEFRKHKADSDHWLEGYRKAGLAE